MARSARGASIDTANSRCTSAIAEWLGGCPLERGQPLHFVAAQRFAAFLGKCADDGVDRPFPLAGNGLHH